jgi:DNA-binding transcriptional ArsR family regulator
MDGEDEAVLAAVEDEYARAILGAVAAEPLSGPELVDRLDASKPTVYRRLSTLEELELVATRVEPDDGGHHKSVYVAAVDAIHVHVEPRSVAVEVDRQAEDAVDRFRQLVGDLS